MKYFTPELVLRCRSTDDDVSEAANESKWVQDELQYALGRELEGTLKIVPVRRGQLR